MSIFTGNAKPKGATRLIVAFYVVCAISIISMTLLSTWVKLSTRHIVATPLEKKIEWEFKQKKPKSTVIKKNSNSDSDIEEEEDWRSTKSVFRQILKRAISSNKTCLDVPPKSKLNSTPVSNTTLPPNLGIVDAISSWLSKKNIPEEEMCRLPPQTSCNETGWTAIFMSYVGSHKLFKLHGNVIKIVQRNQSKEVVLVWNSPRSTFNDSLLLKWDKMKNHKFRIFYALEHGLTNSLFNRYHPAIKPKSQALLYYDDDGPLFKRNPIISGFELWRRNSGVQIGAFPRKINLDTDLNRRMHDKREEEIIVSERQVLNGWQSVSPYDRRGTQKALSQIPHLNTDIDRHPEFIPFCPLTGGDNLVYSYKEFYPYRAHMTLPSSSFIHRDFLCFLWHPVFEELRRFVLDHPTHADDITTSTIISHVGGKAPKTYTRRTKPRKEDLKDIERERKKRLKWSITRITRGAQQNMTSKAQFDMENQNVTKRRRLLWNNDDWADLRTEAINSIVGFFGSINPGSVGYCVGSPDYIPKKRICKKINYSILEDLPWLNKGMIGYDQCPSINYDAFFFNKFEPMHIPYTENT